LADTEKTVINEYNCWGLKKFMGKEYDGILRKTFVIENNKIIKVFDKVKTASHYEQIMEALN
jgi:peroxiredoxin Q/BCP